MFGKLTITAIGMAVMVTLTAGPASAAVIDTITGWNGSDRVATFGEPNSATYGQTVTVGSDNYLKSFSFMLDQTSQVPGSFQGYVMQWNHASRRAVGEVLYSSPVISGSTTGFETFTFNTGGLALARQQQYVLFVNCSNQFDGNGYDMAMASRRDGDVYDGGLFVYLNNGGNFGQVTTSSWTLSHVGSGGDAAFRAEFTPEPATMAMLVMLALSLPKRGGLALVRRRKLLKEN
jgi:hypothetical protein